MKIKAIKSGKFAHSDPALKPVILKEGQLIEEKVSPAMAARMVDTGWAEVVMEDPDQSSFDVEKQEMTPPPEPEPEKQEPKKPKKRAFKKKKKDE